MKAIEIKYKDESNESIIIVVPKIENISIGKRMDFHDDATNATGLQKVEKTCYTINMDSGKYATVSEDYIIIDCDTEKEIPFNELKDWFKKQIKEL